MSTEREQIISVILNGEIATKKLITLFQGFKREDELRTLSLSELQDLLHDLQEEEATKKD